MLSHAERRVLRAYLRAIVLAEPLQRDLAARHGVSLGDLSAVRSLARLGPTPVSQFGAELGLPRSTITNLVDRLEGAGLVERAASPTDRRITLVRLAPAGEQVVEAVTLLRDSVVAKRLLALDPATQETLAGILEQVLAFGDDADPIDTAEAGA